MSDIDIIKNNNELSKKTSLLNTTSKQNNADQIENVLIDINSIAFNFGFNRGGAD